MGKNADSRDLEDREDAVGAEDAERGALDTYRDKRSADQTTEPFGLGRRPVDTAARQFVVQMHGARRLHWDLRLEIDGVLRSWAVPKGPCIDPAEKRLAVLTEDHPLEYVDFEGVIPDGNYGAGPMIVWDRGTWLPLEPVDEGFEKGKLLFELRGYKLRGVWTLFRTKRGEGKEWLLVKKPDGASSEAGATEPTNESILSGLTLEELRDGNQRAAVLRERLVELTLPRADDNPGPVEVMLAEIRERPFSREGWLFELKYDGFRLVAVRDAHGPRLQYRSGRDATALFPDVLATVKALPFSSFIVDGEVVVLDDDGHPNFQRLQKRTQLKPGRALERAVLANPATFYAFDLLAVDGFDTRGLPLHQRKQLLRELLPSAGPIRYADHIERHGEALFEEIKRRGAEGIVAKEADAPYVPGRSSRWQKIRIERSDDFVIVGFTLPEGTRIGFGALHLASHVGDELTYVGRVGTGFGDRQLTQLREVLEAARRSTPACTGNAPSGTKHVWVEPERVCEVKFKQITADLFLRHPSFQRMRDDKTPDACRLYGYESPQTPAPEPEGADAEAEPRREVVISNPDKLFWPKQELTKLDLIEYYRAISPWLLPYLNNRLLVLTRYPDGIEGKSFFQKNAPPYIPDWLRTETMWSEHAEREIEYFVCEDVESLAYVANMGTIPLHIWGSRIRSLQRPDWCILDLDPKGAPFTDVVRIALRIRELCDEIGLPSFPKTSGSTGLHVLVPLGRTCSFEQCRQLGNVLARVVSDDLPDIATIARTMRQREGRVYIDFLQNGHGRLLVAPFSVRPLPGAPVSTPLTWDEVNEDLDHQAFTMQSVPPRMEHLGEDPLRPVIDATPDLQGALAKLAAKL